MAKESTQQEKQFFIQRIYTRDISFETPNSPHIFTAKWEPQIEFNLRTNTQRIQENLFDVGLTVTVTVKLDEKTAYLVEVCQAGIFLVAGFGDEEMSPMLGSYCPNILFPYAREVVSDLVNRGGFPPLLLAPVNFDALYAQKMQERQAAASSSIN